MNIDDNWQWDNDKPKNYKVKKDEIIITSSPKSDYWRKTHYGFIRHNGNFFYQKIKGNFKISIDFQGKYEELYDQAGLMLKINEKEWIKTGIEYVDGIQKASVVVTNEYSDWSVIPLQKPSEWFTIQLERKEETVQVTYSNDLKMSFDLLRMTFIRNVEEVNVGIFVASPTSEKGFETHFKNIIIEKNL
eukprot:gene4135-7445_t